MIFDDCSILSRREQVEAVLDVTTDGMIVLSPDGKITLANATALKMLELSAEDILDKAIPLEELLRLTPSEAEAYGNLLDCEHDIELQRDGQRLVLRICTTPITGASGTDFGQVISLRDITSEDEVVQMKNEFVSTVSHELRTPLTSIKGYVDLILDGDAGEINEIQREFLSIVKENSDRLVNLINDMLDISRIESGRIHLKVEPESVYELAEGAVDTFRAVLAQTGRSVELELDDDLPMVLADRDRVRQVLINLISNALKYSPEGGRITLQAVRDTDSNCVKFCVTDEGLGISEEDQKLLFTKFYRVDSALTREIGGTGLGLSICKSIIEHLGGEIGAVSALGEGSTFWFTLPTAPEQSVKLPKKPLRPIEGGLVLVVDSDVEVAALIETYLRRRGFEVLQAHCAEDALALAIAAKPDVITLDVILEEGDGFALLTQLKEHPDTLSIPVVVLSVVCDEGRSCRFGAANYLEKPIDQGQLLDIVSSLAGSTDSPMVLIVDDDRSVNNVLAEILRRRGFTVAQAFDGTEAIGTIAHKRPDLMLLDLRMPKMDGYEVIKTVKKHPEWGEIPIVVMTAHAVDLSQVDILAETAAQISKPLSPNDIAARVEQFFSARNEEEEG